ncbi:hypothetical protein D8674_031288 [Pyrus ussuriensis x Pyrus communis]|uniref:MULE transposase domain-containing protein n=1 Tax=Pyrus ussuriensis x Pyrus communis TaxID=2448454 RepID=A0A5N5EY39_9ROSA|nr:hypothetical protein D8674_031288 [Pyrus ussuriensis x Pyrus communis]
MSKAGIPPCQILSSLQQSNPHLQVVSQNIYNQIAKVVKERLARRGFTYNIEYDREGHLTHLIFGYPYMDCIYKTNKSKMSLLDIIGVSSFNTSFYFCFVFMKNEKKEDYVFDNHPMMIISDKELALMNAIQIVFPSTSNLLCMWHIEKNILANSWSSFEVKYKEKKFVLAYILSMWLPNKEKFVSAYSDKVTHFSNRATSRAQGAHATLKKYLQFRFPFFKEVVTHVSRFALTKEMNIEVSQLNDIHPRWRIDTRLFLNDRHASLNNKYEKLHLTQKENIKSQLSEFLDTSLPLILEPNVKPHKGRLVGSKIEKNPVLQSVVLQILK